MTEIMVSALASAFLTGLVGWVACIARRPTRAEVVNLIRQNCLYLPDRKGLAKVPEDLSDIKADQAAILVKVDFLCIEMGKLNGKRSKQ